MQGEDVLDRHRHHDEPGEPHVVDRLGEEVRHEDVHRDEVQQGPDLPGGDVQGASAGHTPKEADDQERAVRCDVEKIVDPERFAMIGEVEPGGHFFGSPATMERYLTAFYEPLVSDWRNFGQWTDNGSHDAGDRATGVWRSWLADYAEPPIDDAVRQAIDDQVARRVAAGGSEPES